MNDFLQMTRSVTFRHSHQIKRACQPVLDGFDLGFVGYYTLSHKGVYSYLGTDLGWSEYFAEEKLYEKYPFYTNPKNFKSEVHLLSLVKERGCELIVQAAKEKFGLQQGVMLVNKIGKDVEGFAFFLKTEDPIYLALLLKDLHLLKLFAKEFKKENPFLFSCLKDHAIDLKTLVGSPFEKKVSLVPSISNREGFLEKFGVKNPFTKREFEVMQLLRLGFPAKQVAFKLELSSRTVEHHIERMKDKLGCDSKAELIIRSHRLGIFD